jgi:hypothetical protein
MKPLSSVDDIEFDVPHTKTIKTYPVTAYHHSAGVLKGDLVVTEQSGTADVHKFVIYNDAWESISVAEKTQVEQDIINKFIKMAEDDSKSSFWGR